MARPSRRAVAYLTLWAILGVIVVVRRAPLAPVEHLPAATAAAPFRIHLNSDPWHRIALIEGIGETLARRIVATRERDGAFRTLADVKRIPGIPDRPIDEAAAWIVLD